MSPEAENGTSREELVARLDVMEAMVAEGRRATGRFGWIFVLWGLVCLSGIGVQYLGARSGWVWPVVIACGFAVQFAGIALHRRNGTWASGSTRSRSIAAVWRMMAVAIILYALPAGIQHRAGQITYIIAIFMFLGMAHAISATILRWRAQALVAAAWWAGGVACYFVPQETVIGIYVAEMVCCMVLFGLYAMRLERRRVRVQGVANHA